MCVKQRGRYHDRTVQYPAVPDRDFDCQCKWTDWPNDLSLFLLSRVSSENQQYVEELIGTDL
jgi:hypothetical protein